MLDEYKSIRCPYCNTVYDKLFGSYTWYKYQDKHVVIENHSCGDFICTPNDNTLYNIMRKYSFNGFPLELRNDICKVVQENLKRTKNEDDLCNIIKETLEPDCTEEFAKRSADIKMIIEIVLSWATQPLWSEPVTIGTRMKLKRVGIMRM